MNLEIDWLSYVWTQRHHGRIEALEMTDLQERMSGRSSLDHPIRFFESSGHWFLNQHVDAGFQQGASNLAVHFSWYRETNCIDVADQIAPVRCPVNLSLFGDGSRS